MKFDKNGAAGFSLIEVIVAIAVLGMAVIPLSGGLIVSHRLNARSEQVLEARLAVSSAVEALMAEGISEEFEDTYPNVTITIGDLEPESAAYPVTVSSDIVDGVTVRTHIRPQQLEGGGTG